MSDIPTTEAGMAGKEVLEKLSKVEKNTASETRVSKIRLFLSVLATAAAICAAAGVLYMVSVLIPAVQQTTDNLNTVIKELDEVDFVGLAKSIQQTAEDGSTGIGAAVTDLGRALATLESIDIEQLNAGIDGLYKVVAPLSRLFGGG